jgi:hypothetical protein
VIEACSGIDLLRLLEALEASWDQETSFEGVSEAGNPAFGQCYPTAWVVQQFFPRFEIARGSVWTGLKSETHFWNISFEGGQQYHLDLSWQQFPHGSSVLEYEVLDRTTLGDSDRTVARCELLRDRVVVYLEHQLRPLDRSVARDR